MLCNNVIECKTVSIPSIQEYKKYQEYIPETEYPWWARTRCESEGQAFAIDGKGSIESYSIDNPHIGIRPVIRIDPGVRCKRGDVFSWYGFSWTIIDKIGTELFAICNTIVFKSPFDSYQNKWDASTARSLLQWSFIDASESKFLYKQDIKNISS